jgi:MoxR-like ATPase
MSTDLPEITERRQVTVGGVQWTVNEFGDRYMLVATANSSSAQFSVHFTAEQWSEFQKLVSP